MYPPPSDPKPKKRGLLRRLLDKWRIKLEPELLAEAEAEAEAHVLRQQRLHQYQHQQRDATAQDQQYAGIQPRTAACLEQQSYDPVWTSASKRRPHGSVPYELAPASPTRSPAADQAAAAALPSRDALAPPPPPLPAHEGADRRPRMPSLACRPLESNIRRGMVDVALVAVASRPRPGSRGSGGGCESGPQTSGGVVGSAGSSVVGSAAVHQRLLASASSARDYSLDVAPFGSKLSFAGSDGGDGDDRAAGRAGVGTEAAPSRHSRRPSGTQGTSRSQELAQPAPAQAQFGRRSLPHHPTASAAEALTPAGQQQPTAAPLQPLDAHAAAPLVPLLPGSQDDDSGGTGSDDLPGGGGPPRDSGARRGLDAGDAERRAQFVIPDHELETDPGFMGTAEVEAEALAVGTFSFRDLEAVQAPAAAAAGMPTAPSKQVPARQGLQQQQPHEEGLAALEPAEEEAEASDGGGGGVAAAGSGAVLLTDSGLNAFRSSSELAGSGAPRPLWRPQLQSAAAAAGHDSSGGAHHQPQPQRHQGRPAREAPASGSGEPGKGGRHASAAAPPAAGGGSAGSVSGGDGDGGGSGSGGKTECRLGEDGAWVASSVQRFGMPVKPSWVVSAPTAMEAAPAGPGGASAAATAWQQSGLYHPAAGEDLEDTAAGAAGSGYAGPPMPAQATAGGGRQSRRVPSRDDVPQPGILSSSLQPQPHASGARAAREDQTLADDGLGGRHRCRSGDAAGASPLMISHQYGGGGGAPPLPHMSTGAISGSSGGGGLAGRQLIMAELERLDAQLAEELAEVPAQREHHSLRLGLISSLLETSRTTQPAHAAYAPGGGADGAGGGGGAAPAGAASASASLDSRLLDEAAALRRTVAGLEAREALLRFARMEWGRARALMAGVRVSRRQATPLQAILFSDTLARIRAFQRQQQQRQQVEEEEQQQQQHPQEQHRGPLSAQVTYNLYGDSAADAEDGDQRQRYWDQQQYSGRDRYTDFDMAAERGIQLPYVGGTLYDNGLYGEAAPRRVIVVGGGGGGGGGGGAVRGGRAPAAGDDRRFTMEEEDEEEEVGEGDAAERGEGGRAYESGSEGEDEEDRGDDGVEEGSDGGEGGEGEEEDQEESEMQSAFLASCITLTRTSLDIVGAGGGTSSAAFAAARAAPLLSAASPFSGGGGGAGGRAGAGGGGAGDAPQDAEEEELVETLDAYGSLGRGLSGSGSGGGGSTGFRHAGHYARETRGNGAAHHRGGGVAEVNAARAAARYGDGSVGGGGDARMYGGPVGRQAAVSGLAAGGGSTAAAHHQTVSRGESVGRSGEAYGGSSVAGR
ncbi:hypothetical protein GPECTOR_6g721 [Gonium pectorale]|uniref:Uncharacterized protein n=1 Tax=Gonium pectorale TaxID=33097 RepID=A0A150GVL8_GONPE|nr:hypothetical protein GPECTOR_6g721 [Gonium pectorale]|eukprot:KXZ53803.1 hypothetical protein GPECTOR_6g721 [Gonium pectorale]